MSSIRLNPRATTPCPDCGEVGEWVSPKQVTIPDCFCWACVRSYLSREAEAEVRADPQMRRAFGLDRP